jgi:RHS repeat-associated protein
MGCSAYTYCPVFEPQKKRFKKVLTSEKTTLKAHSAYLYGFNGQEKDNEIDGSGNSYDFGARMYDARLGRWLSVDPYTGKYPAASPYHYAANSPIMMIDPNGEWVAKFSSDNKSVLFVAEEGDNMQTLAVQLGVDYKVLLETYPDRANWKMTAGTAYTFAKIPQVKAMNNYLSREDIAETNCANLALSCNNIQSENFQSDGGKQSMEKGTETVKEATPIEENATQIGDIVTYRYTRSGYEDYLLSNGMQDLPEYQNADGSMKTSEELAPVIDNLYKNQTDIQHFSIVLLKDKSGTQIQQVLEKPGEYPVRISNGTGDGTIFEKSGVINTGDSGVYHPKATPNNSNNNQNQTNPPPQQ